MSVTFSVIVVMLNPGDKLRITLDSIRKQLYRDYEVIIKDGGSKDGSIQSLENYKDINYRLIEQSDRGIYDAMNQAVCASEGKYIYFLNCGDCFHSEDVLLKMYEQINRYFSKDSSEGSRSKKYIFYGNIIDSLTHNKVVSNPSIDGFACYRNLPCHQACFYDESLVKEHPFELRFKVRADYEQFLWCFYKAKTQTVYVDMLIADYEGGGFSETKEHLKVSASEHDEITSMYMEKKDILRYKMILMLTLSPIRTWISHNPYTAGFYNRLKALIYKR